MASLVHRVHMLATRPCCHALAVCVFLCAPWIVDDHTALANSPSQGLRESERVWGLLITQAEGLGLPIQFLTRIPPGVVKIEFEDLRTFAAEYHPAQHRMVLNRTLSFNAAGSVLRPLSQLHHRDLATLYHELFHAYMDFITDPSVASVLDPESKRLLVFARQQQACRYQQVMITPVRHQKSLTEARFLTDSESWEALNETWAVFVEWATWTRLELRERESSREKEVPALREWLERLRAVHQEGTLVGFYEPEDPNERAITHKRYLAPSHRITQAEVGTLLQVIFEESSSLVQRSAVVMGGDGDSGEGLSSCKGE